MASIIWLYTKDQMPTGNLIKEDKYFRNTNTKIIAKGNIFEGIEAQV